MHCFMKSTDIFQDLEEVLRNLRYLFMKIYHSIMCWRHAIIFIQYQKLIPCKRVTESWRNYCWHFVANVMMSLLYVHWHRRITRLLFISTEWTTGTVWWLAIDRMRSTMAQRIKPYDDPMVQAHDDPNKEQAPRFSLTSWYGFTDEWFLICDICLWPMHRRLQDIYLHCLSHFEWISNSYNAQNEIISSNRQNHFGRISNLYNALIVLTSI